MAFVIGDFPLSNNNKLFDVPILVCEWIEFVVIEWKFVLVIDVVVCPDCGALIELTSWKQNH